MKKKSAVISIKDSKKYAYTRAEALKDVEKILSLSIEAKDLSSRLGALELKCKLYGLI